MTQVVSPSSFNLMTSGQMNKFYELLFAALRKSGLPSEPTQQVLESQGAALADEFVKSVCRRVEAVSNMIVRHATVNRERTPWEMLGATGRRQYTDCKVVAVMPRGEGSETDVFFFKVGRFISDVDLEKEYELRGLKSDPYAQAAVNETDLAFADEHPNGCHWQDKDGNWCFTAFNQWNDDERRVGVDRDGDNDWSDCWWFAGVRK